MDTSISAVMQVSHSFSEVEGHLRNYLNALDCSIPKDWNMFGQESISVGHKGIHTYVGLNSIETELSFYLVKYTQSEPVHLTPVLRINLDTTWKGSQIAVETFVIIEDESKPDIELLTQFPEQTTDSFSKGLELIKEATQNILRCREIPEFILKPLNLKEPFQTVQSHLHKLNKDSGIEVADG